MTAIQIILITGMVIMIAMLVYNLRKSSFLRPLLIVIALFGIYLILYPDFAMVIANKVGVDEAADLLTYLFIVGISIVLIHLYTIIRNLQQDITKLVRENSLKEAAKLGVERKEDVAEEANG